MSHVVPHVVPHTAPVPVQTALHLVAQLKSPEDSQQLKAQLLASMDGMQQGMDSVGTVHFAHWFFLDNDTRVVLTTEYDGDFNAYILAFIKAIGPLFDVLLSHVIDPPPLPVVAHPNEFIKWVSDHNVPVTGKLITAYPKLTVLAIRNLERLAASDS
jgi:hypothetical protein